MNNWPSAVCIAEVIHQRLCCGETEYKTAKNNTCAGHEQEHSIAQPAQ